MQIVLKDHQFVLLPQGNNTKTQIHTKKVNYNILYFKSFWLHMKGLEDQNSPRFLKSQITV